MSQNTRNIFNCQSNDKARYFQKWPVSKHRAHFREFLNATGRAIVSVAVTPIELDPNGGWSERSNIRHWEARATRHQTITPLALSLFCFDDAFSSPSLPWWCSYCRKEQVGRLSQRSREMLERKLSGLSDIITLLVGVHCSDTAGGCNLVRFPNHFQVSWRIWHGAT